MQQFRPLPRFDQSEDAEPVEMPLAPTTDPMPALTDPRFAAAHVPPAFPMPTITDPRLAATKTPPAFPMPTITDPRLAATKTPPAFPMPTMTDPRLAATNVSPASPTPTTGRQQSVKLPTTGKYPSLAAALQATMEAKAGANGETSRLVVIPGARKKSGKTARRLNPRLRQGVIFLATVVILLFTLTTLVPLSDSQNGGNIFSNIGGWIHSAQLDWDIQAHQNTNAIPTQLNGPGLPYMAIADSPYVAIAEQDASAAGIPPVYFVRQIQQESGFNPNAVSVTNAQGIAQFEPYTASGLGIDPWNPVDALRGAARLMANYYHQYGNYAKALGAYNAGGGAVQNAVYSCGMYWLGCMPAQTQNYVYRIMGV